MIISIKEENSLSEERVTANFVVERQNYKKQVKIGKCRETQTNS